MANRPAFVIERQVEFHETDMAGIVHFSNFFRYMEAAEHAFLRGLNQELSGSLEGTESGWPRVHASCDYRAPARFGDVLSIRLSVEEVRERSIRYRFEIMREETLIAEGNMVSAHVRRQGNDMKAVALPEDLRQKLES